MSLVILERDLLTKGTPRIIRVLKPLRWFKLARLVKLGKADQIMDSFTDYFTISPRASKTVKVREEEKGAGMGDVKRRGNERGGGMYLGKQGQQADPNLALFLPAAPTPHRHPTLGLSAPGRCTYT